jgi:hypothetical protein
VGAHQIDPFSGKAMIPSLMEENSSPTSRQNRLGIDNMQIKENLPTLEEVLESSEMLLDLTGIDKKPLKQIAVILDGVMLEDGQLVGPQKLNIRQLIEERLQQNPGESK